MEVILIIIPGSPSKRTSKDMALGPYKAGLKMGLREIANSNQERLLSSDHVVLKGSYLTGSGIFSNEICLNLSVKTGSAKIY